MKALPPENHFAALGIQPHIWPDADELKERYHKLAGASHPDKADGDSVRFQSIETAYRVLARPATRLKHLAGLAEPENASASENTPPEFSDFMFELGSFLQQLKAFRTEQRLAGSTIARALLAPGQIELQEEAMRFQVRIAAMQSEMEASTRALAIDDASGLRAAASAFTYLDRAANQLHTALSGLLED